MSRISIIIFVHLFSLAPLTAKAEDLVGTCQKLWKYLLRDPAFTRDRAMRALDIVVAKYRNQWVLSQPPPETVFGVDEAEGFRWLKSLSRNKLKSYQQRPFYQNAAWGNSVTRIHAGQFEGLVKVNYRRTSLDSERLQAVTNDVRYEVLAYHLDRYLGINLVPPVVLLDHSTAVVLFIPRLTLTSHATLSKNPEYLMTLSHVHLLDTMLHNHDRKASGNLMLSASGSVVAIDFDMAKPNWSYFGSGPAIEFVVEAMNLPFADGMLRNGPMPGVIKASVLQRLKQLDESVLLQLASAAGVTLSDNEKASLLGGRDLYLKSIDRWIESYGQRLVVIDEDQ